MIQTILCILAVVLGFSTIIGVHEACHMLAAKAFGVRVLKFSLGFGPVLFAHKIGDTSYEVRLLPLGGFVQMSGEDPSNLDVEGGFFNLAWYKRALIALAGPTANLILGFIFIFIALTVFHNFPIVEGLHKSCTISSLVVTETTKGVSSMVVGKESATGLSGPIMITKYLINSFKSGMDDFFFMLSILSLSIGLMNFVPIPGLDGGHVFLYLLEGLSGKRLSEKVYVAWSYFGMALLLALMTFVIYIDVVRLLK